MRFFLSLSFIIASIAMATAQDGNPIPIADLQRRDAVDFDDEVLPIFQRNCLACHNERESQGGLVLESPAGMRKGGDTGPALIPARGADSLLLQLVSHQTDPVMPPIGNDVNAKQLTSQELGLIRLWIDQGARQSKSTAMLSPRSLNPISARIAPAYSLDLTEDGQHLAVTRANQLFLYHVPTGRLVTHFHDPALNDSNAGSDDSAIAHRDLIQSVAFNREGDLLASGGFREAKLWRRPSDVTVLELKAGAAFTAVAVSPDRQLIAAALDDNDLQIWESATGKPMHLLKGHADRITTLRFTQSGRLVSASLDHSIRLWDVQQGTQTAIIETPSPINAMELTAIAPPVEAEDANQSVEASEKPSPPSTTVESQEIVTGGPDKLVRTWTVPQGSPTRWPLIPEGLTQATFSHDNQWIAFGQNDGMTVVMHRGDDGDFKPLAQWKLPTGPSVATSFLMPQADAASSDSPDKISCPNLITTATDGTITAWSLADRLPIGVWQTGTNDVTTIATSHDGKWLATGGKDGSISLWNQLAPAIDSFDTLTGNAVTVIAKNKSNTRLAVAGVSNGQAAIFVYDSQQGQLLYTLLGHSSPIRSIAYASDNNRIVSGGDDRTVRIWNPQDTQNTQQHRLEGFPAPVTAVALSPDDSQVVAGLADNSVALRSLADPASVQDLKGHSGVILGVGYIGNDPFSISADRTVRFWNQADGTQVRSFDNQATTHAFAINPEGTLLALSSGDNSIRVFQASDGKLLHTLSGHLGVPSSLAFSQDSKKIVATVAVNDQPAETTIWDLQVSPPRRQEVLRESTATAAFFGQQPDHLIIGDRSGRIVKRPLRFVRHLAGNTQSINALAFHPNNQTLFTASQDGSLRGYSIASGQQSFATSHGAAIHTLTITPNQQVLLTGGENAVVRLWQINGSPYGPQQIPGLGGPVQSVAVTGDNSRLIVATAGEKPRATVYDLTNATPLQQSTLNQQPVIGLAALAATPTASSRESILSISADSVWHWSTDAVRVLAGHSGEVNSLAAMPTEPRQIWSGGADNTIRLWNLDNGQSIRQVNHGGSVLGLAVHPDGQRLASVSENRTAKLWNLNGQQVAEMRGDIRLKAQASRLTLQQTSGTALVNVSKQRLEAAQKDEPLKMQAEQKASETLMAATKTLADKQMALDKSSAEKLAAEQEAIQSAAAARSAVVTKTTADEAYKLAAAAVTRAQQRATQLTSIANAMPSDEAIKLSLVDANQVVASSQATAQQLQQAMQGPAEALQAATAAANKATEKAATYQKPYNDLLAEIKLLTAAKNLAVQQHEIAVREWKEAQARIPVAEKTLADAEADLQSVKQQLESATKTLADAEMPIRSVAFSPDGSVLVTAGDYRNAHLWDAETGVALAAYAGHEDAMTGACFIDDDRFLSVSTDRSLRVWQRNPPWKLEKTIGSIDQPELISHRVTSLDFSPDSAQLLVAGGVPSRNGEVSVFNISDSKLLLALPQAHDDVIHSARFSPDGQRIATAGADKYMRTFDIASTEMLRRFEGHTNYVLGLSWKGDGQTLVTASADSTIKVWDAETADQKRTISNFGKHVTQVRFVGDTDNVVSSCGDRIVRMHNSQNGGNVRTFNGADQWLHCVDVSADSTIVAAGSQSGTVYVWNGLNGQPLQTILVGPPSPHPPTPQ